MIILRTRVDPGGVAEILVLERGVARQEAKLLDGQLADAHRTIEVQRRENEALGKENAALREKMRRQSAQLVSEQRTRRWFEYALYFALFLAAMWVGVSVGSWLVD